MSLIFFLSSINDHHVFLNSLAGCCAATTPVPENWKLRGVVPHEGYTITLQKSVGRSNMFVLLPRIKFGISGLAHTGPWGSQSLTAAVVVLRTKMTNGMAPPSQENPSSGKGTKTAQVQTKTNILRTTLKHCSKKAVPFFFSFSHTFTFQLLDTIRGHRCRPFFPPVLAFNFYRA